MGRETYELVSMSYHALPFAQAPPLCKHHYLKAIVFRTMSHFAYSTPPPPLCKRHYLVKPRFSVPLVVPAQRGEVHLSAYGSLQQYVGVW